MQLIFFKSLERLCNVNYNIMDQISENKSYEGLLKVMKVWKVETKIVKLTSNLSKGKIWSYYYILYNETKTQYPCLGRQGQ
jgi:hypothetical protein